MSNSPNELGNSIEMSELIVSVQQGKLKGFSSVTDDGKKYTNFLGIPYAEPPVGNLRFKYPIPKKPWNGVRDALNEGGISCQLGLLDKEFSGQDDCLYLNVHVPKVDPKSGPLPVIVNIHAGGFVSWSSTPTLFGPQYIMEKDTILVTFNYRLGLIGFLCTDPANARGDMGLLDQQLALKWTKENISAFGGDSNNITIFGISAGAASVEYHMLVKDSHPYFNKAIMHSGSAAIAWANSKKPIKFSMRLARELGYKGDEKSGLFDFLNKFDSETLCVASKNLVTNEDRQDGVIFPFFPVTNYFKDNKGFLCEDPGDLIRRGKIANVPTLAGLCEQEGMMVQHFFSEEAKKELNEEKFLKYVPEHLDKKIVHCNEIFARLYKQRPDQKNSHDHILNFFSDLTFEGGMMFALENRLKYNPNNHYFFRFTYDGNMNLMKFMMQSKEKGACHADEMSYLGPAAMIPKENETKLDKAVRNRMATMWTNFAKFGDPTPKLDNVITEKWLPTTFDNYRYLEIGDELKMRDNLMTDRRKIWKHLYG